MWTCRPFTIKWLSVRATMHHTHPVSKNGTRPYSASGTFASLAWCKGVPWSTSAQSYLCTCTAPHVSINQLLRPKPFTHNRYDLVSGFKAELLSFQSALSVEGVTQEIYEILRCIESCRAIGQILKDPPPPLVTENWEHDGEERITLYVVACLLGLRTQKLRFWSFSGPSGSLLIASISASCFDHPVLYTSTQYCRIGALSFYM